MSDEHGGISHGYIGMSGESCWAEHGGHPVRAMYIDMHSIGCGDYVCVLFLDLLLLHHMLSLRIYLHFWMVDTAICKELIYDD